MDFVGVPVIIEEELEHWPARKWSLDYLLDKVGDNPVNVRGNTDSTDYKVRSNTFLSISNNRVATYLKIIGNQGKVRGDFDDIKGQKKCQGNE